MLNASNLDRALFTDFKETHHGQISHRMDAGRARLCTGPHVVFLLMASKPDPGLEPERDAPEKGLTLPSRHQHAEPRMPHERDESSDSHPGTGDERVEQAARDLANGLQDTDRSPVVTKLARQEFPSHSGKGQKAAKNTNS